jgi:uncharacterized membrane protein (UPF0182 family)
MQLDAIIESDVSIAKELESVNVTGTRITRNMLVVPIDNTVLYVEAIYQTLLNEESKVPVLKKVVVASRKQSCNWKYIKRSISKPTFEISNKY